MQPFLPEWMSLASLLSFMIVLAARLRQIREELDRVRCERDTYARAIQLSPLTAAAVRELTALPVEGPVGGERW